MPYHFRKCSCFNSPLFRIFCLVCFHPFKQQERIKLLIHIRWAELQMWFNRSLIWGWNFFTKERFMFISFDCFLSFYLEWIDSTFHFLIFFPLPLLFIYFFAFHHVSWLFWDVKFERALILRWLLCCIPKWSAYVCTSASEDEPEGIQEAIAKATEWHFGGLGSKSICK